MSVDGNRVTVLQGKSYSHKDKWFEGTFYYVNSFGEIIARVRDDRVDIFPPGELVVPEWKEERGEVVELRTGPLYSYKRFTRGEKYIEFRSNGKIVQKGFRNGPVLTPLPTYIAINNLHEVTRFGDAFALGNLQNVVAKITDTDKLETVLNYPLITEY